LIQAVIARAVVSVIRLDPDDLVNDVSAPVILPSGYWSFIIKRACSVALSIIPTLKNDFDNSARIYGSFFDVKLSSIFVNVVANSS
jgi:hypothetical protein